MWNGVSVFFSVTFLIFTLGCISALCANSSSLTSYIKTKTMWQTKMSAVRYTFMSYTHLCNILHYVLVRYLIFNIYIYILNIKQWSNVVFIFMSWIIYPAEGDKWQDLNSPWTPHKISSSSLKATAGLHVKSLEQAMKRKSWGCYLNSTMMEATSLVFRLVFSHCVSEHGTDFLLHILICNKVNVGGRIKSVQVNMQYGRY